MRPLMLAIFAAFAITAPAHAQSSTLSQALLSVCLPFTGFEQTILQTVGNAGRQGFRVTNSGPGADMTTLQTPDGAWRIHLWEEPKFGGQEAVCAIVQTGSHLDTFETIINADLVALRSGWSYDLDEEEAAWERRSQLNGRRLSQDIDLSLRGYGATLRTQAKVTGLWYGQPSRP